MPLLSMSLPQRDTLIFFILHLVFHNVFCITSIPRQFFSSYYNVKHSIPQEYSLFNFRCSLRLRVRTATIVLPVQIILCRQFHRPLVTILLFEVGGQPVDAVLGGQLLTDLVDQRSVFVRTDGQSGAEIVAPQCFGLDGGAFQP